MKVHCDSPFPRLAEAIDAVRAYLLKEDFQLPWDFAVR